MKRIFGFALALGLLILMISSVAAVSAEASEEISGSWQFTGITPVSEQAVGGNCIIVRGFTQNYAGDLAGTVTGEVRIVHQGACDQPAVEVFHTEGSFQGTVNGTAGTFDFQGEGRVDNQGNLQGQFVILAGSEGLSNLHGQFDVAGSIVTFSGGYSGDIHFD